MSELTLTVMRLGFLAVLWLFVIVAVQVIRSDLFGTRVTQRGARRDAARPQQTATRQGQALGVADRHVQGQELVEEVDVAAGRR
ncbi:FHA domain-containing protein, partial [Streptomyces tendae]